MPEELNGGGVTFVIPKGYEKISMKNLEKQWIYNTYCYFLYSSGFHSVTASAIKLINLRSQSRLEGHSIGHF